VLGISNRNAQILKLKRRREEKKRQHIWLDHKRHNKREDQCIPYRKRHRSTVESGMHLQKVYSYLREDG